MSVFSTAPTRLNRSMYVTTTARALVIAFGVAAVAACGGGGDKQVEEPARLVSEEPDPEPEPDVVVSAEQLDTVKRSFDRKSKFLNTCFTSAITAGEISKRGSARIAVTVTVTEAGKVKNPKVTSMKPESATLRDCIFDKMARWQLSSLPADLEYSHTFGFATL